ncbi:MAG: acyltransferase family protein [Spirochaetia bacterium]
MQTLALPLAPGAPNRLFYLDTLRIVLTILVIAHHVGQAYGPTGGYWPVQESARAAILGPFFTVNRSFFMSLFFMISGYFMVAAFERHTVGTFIRGKLVRLGIPVLLFAAIMLPSRVFLFGEHITRWNDYINAGHLWYLEHVLLFSIVYALWMTLRKSSRVKTPRNHQDPKRPAPGLPVTITALLVVAALCGVVRIWSPIDRWMNLLGFFRVAFADVPRDLSFFIFGAMAFKRGWFENFSVRAGMAWLAVGVAAAVARYAWSLIPHTAIQMGTQAFAIVSLVWEEVLCFGLCIGLLVLFRQVTTGQGRFGKLLAANQYSAYFWHPLLIVGIQMLIVSLPLGPFIKFVAVTVVGVPIVFFWSWLLRNLRVVRAVF